VGIVIGDKVLITTDAWFHCPDGNEYRAVWGTLRAIRSDEETLGIRTNARSTNWYAEVGNMTLAGCQIHYAIKCDKPNLGEAKDWAMEEGKVVKFSRPSRIFNADAKPKIAKGKRK
jgi:hypothetical protein